MLPFGHYAAEMPGAKSAVRQLFRHRFLQGGNSLIA